MTKELEDGSKVAGLFNPGDSAVQRWCFAGPTWVSPANTSSVTCGGKGPGTFDGEFSADVRRHGVVLVGLRRRERPGRLSALLFQKLLHIKRKVLKVNIKQCQ